MNLHGIFPAKLNSLLTPAVTFFSCLQTECRRDRERINKRFTKYKTWSKLVFNPKQGMTQGPGSPQAVRQHSIYFYRLHVISTVVFFPLTL